MDLFASRKLKRYTGLAMPILKGGVTTQKKEALRYFLFPSCQLAASC
jgi:hypothetical protein